MTRKLIDRCAASRSLLLRYRDDKHQDYDQKNRKKTHDQKKTTTKKTNNKKKHRIQRTVIEGALTSIVIRSDRTQTYRMALRCT